eukprot:1257521-Rhodomonas_salina.1
MGRSCTGWEAKGRSSTASSTAWAAGRAWPARRGGATLSGRRWSERVTHVTVTHVTSGVRSR